MTDLPIEVIRYIFSFTNIKCHICENKLYPWSMIGYGIVNDNFFWGFKQTPEFYFCRENCNLKP